MISEIWHTSREPGREMAIVGASINVVVVLLFALLFSAETSLSSPSCLATVILVGLLDLMLLLVYRFEARLFDTLSFSVGLDIGQVKRRGLVRPLVDGIRGFFASNRISYAEAADTRAMPIRLDARLAAFELGNLGLTLAVFYRSGKAGEAGVLVALGPVRDPADPVARRLLEGLRQELLRCEDDVTPGKKA